MNKTKRGLIVRALLLISTVTLHFEHQVGITGMVAMHDAVE
jgi:hypothetical protein